MEGAGAGDVAGECGGDIGEFDCDAAEVFCPVRVVREVGSGRGFTLVEVLFAIFVGMLLMAVAYIAMTSGQQSSAGVERKVAAQQDVRAAMQTMALEMSMASYNPLFASSIWRKRPGVAGECVDASSDQVYKGIQEASPTSITVEADVGESGAIRDDNNEVIRYVYDGGRQYVTRDTCGGGMPFLGDIPARARSLRVINNDLGIVNGRGDTAVFRYYNAIGAGGTELYPYLPGGDPTQIPNIRRVDITLAVETEERDPSTKARRRMIYSTSVLVRNHALSP